MMPDFTISSDTQAILLLCASFGQSRDSEVKPLSISEYNHVADWLKSQKMRPSSLIDEDAELRWNELLKISAERIKNLLRRGVTMALALEKWKSQGIWILSRADKSYPEKFRKHLRHMSPPILYGVGNCSILSSGGLAIVGSRNVDEEGLEYTRRVSQSCVESGIQVISGAARGVDREAMLSALGAGGSVIGVMADSLSKEAVSAKYREGLESEQLTLISTYDPDARFNVGNAMGRNKYIYSLADYGLVICSDFNKGGTWEGATEVLKRYTSIPVFIKMEGTVSEGNIKLLERGANRFPDSPWKSNLKNLLVNSLHNISESITSQSLLVMDSLNKNGQSESLLLNLDNAYLNSVNQDLAHISNEIESHTSEIDCDPISDATSDATDIEDNVYNAQEKLILETQIINTPTSFYEFFLQIIPKYLEQPKTSSAILEDVNSKSSNDLKKGQLEEYLKRAVAEKKLKKDKSGKYFYSMNQLSIL
ncbi:DNA-processing protein DprA [Pseudanabaena mucicola]|uniref:DNA-processing protein DprA n=1 Tax=Pseudanabaena mucicola TaxID=71190 RepID=UPI0025750CD2|nr:DNA-processing protein DprA [Pseudanabaena mucicola]